MAIKNAHKRREVKAQQKRQQQLMSIGIGIIIIVVVIGLVFITNREGTTSVSFPDIHGMSFKGDGEQLRVATHTGIVAYQNGNWSKPDLPINDYMGYSGTENGFFSSGHPGVGSQLVNPIGLVKSQDHGATITTINFSGETDFHVMGASYYGETIYVLNPAPNSLLSAGLYYSLDSGQTWEQSIAEGLTESPMQIAVHPNDAGMVALATRGGVFLSNDFGMTFTRISDAITVTSVTFDPNGERLLFGLDSLFSYTLSDGQIIALASTPDIDTDQVIFYITLNPINDEIAFATSNRDIFFSSNDGQSWKQIGDNGASL
ncbi:hypothetical protein MASR2M15_22090 [Anaerolineales bacterium]